MNSETSSFHSLFYIHFHFSSFSQEAEKVVYIEKNKELAHTIMEAERSLNLPSASRWPRKAFGSNSVQPQMPKNQRIQWWRSQYEEGRRGWDEMSQLSSEARKRGFLLPLPFLLFYSSPELIGWCPSTLRRMIYFAESTSSNDKLIQKHSP